MAPRCSAGGEAASSAQFVYVKETGEESEPMGANQLAALIVLGQISRESLVRPASGSLRFAQFTKIKAVRSAVAALEAEDGADALMAPTDALMAPAAPAPAQTAAWFYRDDGGNDRGPLRLAEMRRLIQIGMLEPHQPRDVRLGEDGDWQDLALWPELLAEADSEEGAPPAADGGPPEWEEEEIEWVYLDDDGELQGPFGTEEVVGWVQAGHLDRSRQLSIAGGDEFRPMAEWPELALRLSAAQWSAAAEAGAGAGPGPGPELEAGQAAAAGQEAAMTLTEQARMDLARARHGVSSWEKGNKPTELAAPAPAPPGMAPPPPPPTTPPPPPTAPPPPLAPTEAASATETVEPGPWVYVDDAGKEQGPFTTAKLCSWVKRGLLSAERQVRPEQSEASLRPIAAWPELAAAAAVAAAAAAATVAAVAPQLGAEPTAASEASAGTGRSDVAAAAAAAGGVGEAAGSASGAADGTSLSAEEAAVLWEYWDDHGRVQGPFSAAKLLGWLRAGHVKASRMVRPHGSGACAERRLGGATAHTPWPPRADSPGSRLRYAPRTGRTAEPPRAQGEAPRHHREAVSPSRPKAPILRPSTPPRRRRGRPFPRAERHAAV